MAKRRLPTFKHFEIAARAVATARLATGGDRFATFEEYQLIMDDPMAFYESVQQEVDAALGATWSRGGARWLTDVECARLFDAIRRNGGKADRRLTFAVKNGVN